MNMGHIWVHRDTLQIQVVLAEDLNGFDGMSWPLFFLAQSSGYDKIRWHVIFHETCESKMENHNFSWENHHCFCSVGFSESNKNHHVFCFRLSYWSVFLGPESTCNFLKTSGYAVRQVLVRLIPWHLGRTLWDDKGKTHGEKHPLTSHENRCSNRHISCIGLYWMYLYIYISIYVTCYMGRISENGLGRMMLVAHLLLESHSGLPSSWVDACFALSKIHGPLDVGCSFIHTLFELYTAYNMIKE